MLWLASHTSDQSCNQTVPVQGGEAYGLSHRSRRSSEKGEIRLQINWSDSSGTFLGTTIVVERAVEKWTELQIADLSPPTAAQAAVYATAQSGTVWLDDFRFFQVASGALPNTNLGQTKLQPLY